METNLNERIGGAIILLRIQCNFGIQQTIGAHGNFGCLAFASTLPSSRNKFSPRAVPTIFVGYPQGYKGYKLYSLDTKKFFVSRDVVFHESIFPFQTISQPQVIPDPLLDLVIPIPITNTLPNPDQTSSQSPQPTNRFNHYPTDSSSIPGSDHPHTFPSVTYSQFESSFHNLNVTIYTKDLITTWNVKPLK